MLEVRLNEGPCQALVTREAGSVCLGGGGGNLPFPVFIHTKAPLFALLVESIEPGTNIIYS